MGDNIYRDNAGRGLACIPLLSFALLANLYHGNSDDCSSFCLSLIMTFISFVIDVQTPAFRHVSIVPIIGAVIQICLFSLNKGILAFICLAFYARFLPKLFKKFPKSFTFGEGCIVLQGLTLFFFNVNKIFVPTSMDNLSVLRGYAWTGQVGLLSLLTLCSIPILSDVTWNLTIFVTRGVTTIVFFAIPILYFKIGSNPILWVLDSIVASPQKLRLILLWSVCLLICGVVILRQVFLREQATTSVRKAFHFLIVIVFTSGVFIDRELLFLASVVVLCLQLLLEFIRIFEMEPLSSYLNEAFKIFVDSKDAGKLILTNIYLLSGVSLPLWLADDLSGSREVVLLSGVLSTGVGDAAASIVGSKFGRIQVSSSGKTLEGALASVVAQIAFIHLLVNSSISLWLVISVTLVSVVEAYTTQVDNLILPLILYSLLSLSHA